MLADKGGSTSLYYDERFVGTVALPENLPCNLFLAHAAFTEDNHVGISRSYACDFSLDALELLAWTVA